jgi:hypothetical protein
LPGAPASGQVQQPSSQGENPSFGLRAGLFGKTTLEERHFQYAVNPGAVLDDSVEVLNLAEREHTFRLYAADLVQGKDGGLAPSFPEDRQREVGAWIHLDSSSAGLGPKGKTKVPFRLNVPEDATPGDHLGAVVAAFKPPQKPGAVVVESRVALMVRVRIPGVAKLDGTVGPLRLRPGRGARRFTVEVRNTGNLLLTTVGRIEIRNGSETVAVVPVSPKQIYVIPNGKTQFEAEWKGTPLFGKRTATAAFTLSAYKERDIKRSSNTVTMSFFAWSLLLALIVISLAVLWWYRRRRSHGERDPQHAPAPDSIPMDEGPTGERRVVDVDAAADSREWYS